MWLRIKTPSVSDGNNFGVEVQNYVITELAAMRTAVDGFTTTGKDYHWGRASGLDKLYAENKESSEKSETTEVVDAKPAEVKKVTSSKSSSSKPVAHADYAAYLVDTDVKQYHTCFNQLSEIRNNYIKAHLLFAKNLKRLTDPRGEGEDGRSGNVMSMF